MSDFLNQVLFQIGEYPIRAGNLLFFLLALGIQLAGYAFFYRRLKPRYLSGAELDQKDRRKINFTVIFSFILIALLSAVFILQIDPIIFEWSLPDADDTFKSSKLRLSILIEALLVWQIARLLDVVISKIIIQNYYRQKAEEPIETDRYHKATPQRANRIVQSVVYVVALIFVLQSFGIDYDFGAQGEGDVKVDFKISSLLKAALYVLGARLAVWILTQLILQNYYKARKINIGSQYAINQLLQYFIYVIAILMALESLGFSLTVLWGGAAALLVGIGLGLQETFKDFISGIILLFERTVEVGDVLEVDDMVGTVKKIGLRTSLVETRSNKTVIVPNSKLVVDKVVNWSHFDNKVRFVVTVGVAYGSDTALVKKILLQVAKQHPQVIRHPAPFVRFVDFGSSSLDFELHFWSHEFIAIDNVKSDIRFEVDRLFREQKVTIPFPQQDVWIRQGE
ncbi:MAG TPA: mechanosensitive ion channel [Saprospiraceae bacterium]|nr:mechanosensitive ion channel [Saprospiraceae bacterium]HMQ83448.1 mechanosensitive ion channel [Saprospiraceae bacterium]